MIPVARARPPPLPRPSAPIPPLPGSRPPTARGPSSEGPPRGSTRRARASPGTDHPTVRVLPGARSAGRRPSEKTALSRVPRLPPILHLPAGIVSPVPAPIPGPLRGPFSQPRGRPRRPGATALLLPRSPVPPRVTPPVHGPLRRPPVLPHPRPDPPLPREAAPAAASGGKTSPHFVPLSCNFWKIKRQGDFGF